MNVILYTELLTPEALENLLKMNKIIDFDTGTNFIRVEKVNRYSVGDFTISVSDKSKTEFAKIPQLDDYNGITPGVTKDYTAATNFINFYTMQRRYYYD